ncbi:MAG: hypothetical protein JWS12_963 [Candidatus Saccharibacteria bacterium]|nr:hypothetical protein [Candidatus Saccharibacteria bacterium]
MATYKVIQDIEAEDKFVGPLTLKQFVFAGIAAVSAYLSFIALTKGIKFLLFFTVPVIMITTFLAWPWSRDQPTEVWALAKLRFMFKPRRRIWNQSGVQELVTITVPKKIDKQMTNGLDSMEVKSRLRALADTIDSRGWAIKNVNVNLYAQENPMAGIQSSDRLLGLDLLLPKQVPGIDIRADEDMLDAQTSPVAQHLNQMLSKYGSSYKQSLINKVKRGGKNPDEPAEPTPDYWFLHQNQSAAAPKGYSSFNDPAAVLPGSAGSTNNRTATPDEQGLLNDLHRQQSQADPVNSHMKIIQPLGQGDNTSQTPSLGTADPAILNLATNDDLDVATIARQAHKRKGDTKLSDGNEVVIPLR